MDGINQTVSGRLPVLSEQQLVSCSKSNKGCKGGWYVRAFQYFIKNGGITSENVYNYTATDSACRKKLDGHHYQLLKYWLRTPISERSLRRFVFKQPISVSIYASPHFKSYKSGIFSGADCSSMIRTCKNLNHVALIEGCDSLVAGQDYWIVKNSWGSSWGQSGYIFIKRNTGSSRGVCSINCSGAYTQPKGRKKHQF
ncbi:zingipain-1-like [Prosopis cineraria]|uniref:zingipain-1-like n=1 Tax=Prosopis cineraria TaxID=364024 RepID=UPI00240F83EA|nr:zingipain-1-like [Prosopis cineraria]